MARHGTHYEVVEAFSRGFNKPCIGSRMFFERNVLYSYGYHHPLAVRMKDGSGWKFIVNGDTVSRSTSKHLSLVQSWINDQFTLSDSTLRIYGIDISSFLDGSARILDARDEKTIYFNTEEGYRLCREEMPVGATIFWYSKEDWRGQFHFPSTALIRIKRKNGQAYLLCGMDDGQYFCAELFGRHATVDSAFQSMKPKTVVEAEAKEIDVRRQGEWFFIQEDVDNPKRDYLGMEQRVVLPNRDGLSGSHWATRGVKLRRNNHFLVSGTIHHSGNDHPPLKLSTADNPKIYRAILNRVKRAFSDGGTVD